MDPVTIGALVSAAGQTAGAAGGYLVARKNRQFQEHTNRINREWATSNYEMTRNDALKDRDYENAYNSPAAQMKRYKEAGLNPNLIYGSQNEGATVRGNTIQAASQPAPQMDPSWAHIAGQIAPNLVMSFVNNAKIQAETDNLKAQKELIEANTRRSNYDLTTQTAQQADLNKQVVLNTQNTEMDIHKKVQDMDLDLQGNERANRLTAIEIQNKVQDIGNKQLQAAKTEAETDNIKQNLELLKNQQTLQQLEINLRKNGINPNDPMWARIIGQALSDAGAMKDITAWITNWIKK